MPLTQKPAGSWPVAQFLEGVQPVFLYKEHPDEVRFKVGRDTYSEKTVRSIHVYRDGTLIGRIRREPDTEDAHNRFAIEACGTKRNWWHGTIGYADTVVQAKRIAEENMYPAYLDNCNRDNTFNVLKKRQEKALPPASLTYGDNEDFYPTPPAIAGRMLAHVQWTKHTQGEHDCYLSDRVETVLEPSAGKGDLLDALLAFAENHKYDFEWNSSCRNPMWGKDQDKTMEAVDCIEQDPNLQAILKGKGYRVIDDDFLSFESHRKYDLILMNPPFSEGDLHLLKALSLLKPYGGQVVCLLNAATIKNPYTNRRQALVQELGRLGATFEYIKDGFKKAERRTDVEVVIVSVHVPEPPSRSRILEYLKKAPKYTGENEPTAIAVKGDWVRGLIQQYNFEADFGIRLLREYQGYEDYAMTNSEGKTIIGITIDGDKQNGVQTETINKYLRKLRLKFWNRLMHDPQLEKVVGKMTSQMRNEYCGKVNSMKDYEFSEYNIRTLILDMQGQINQGLKDSIMGLFETLSVKHTWFEECSFNKHYFNGWKTNQAHKVGMKCILPMNGFSSYSRENLNTDYIYRQLSDLERVMDFLDRGDTTFHRNLHSFIDYAEREGKTTVECTYFTAAFFKKGTCHIKFREEARHIVDRLNIYAAMNRNWLPPYYGKIRYEDMDDEGKAVIDSFHSETCPSGKKSEKYRLPAYEEVCKNPSNFLTTVDSSSTGLLLGAGD